MPGSAAGCTFCSIVDGETSAVVVFENETTIAFLDRRPLFPGHVLVVPRRHCETLADLPIGLLQPLFGSAQLLQRAIEKGLSAEGVFVAINNRVSQSVPHLHVHLVPRREKDGLKGFFWPRQRYADDDHMREVAARIRSAVDDGLEQRA